LIYVNATQASGSIVSRRTIGETFMPLTLVMLLLLISSYSALGALVGFAENVIRR
jgi:hypothetical protein